MSKVIKYIMIGGLLIAAFILGRCCSTEELPTVIRIVEYKSRVDSVPCPYPVFIEKVDYKYLGSYVLQFSGDTIRLDTTRLVEDCTKRNYYSQTFEDERITFNLQQTILLNRIEKQSYDYTIRCNEVTRTVYKQSTKFGFSTSTTSDFDYIEVKGHILLKQRLDLNVGYNTYFNAATFGVGFYF